LGKWRYAHLSKSAARLKNDDTDRLIEPVAKSRIGQRLIRMHTQSIHFFFNSLQNHHRMTFNTTLMFHPSSQKQVSPTNGFPSKTDRSKSKLNSISADQTNTFPFQFSSGYSKKFRIVGG
jgi:hypothetical protein